MKNFTLSTEVFERYLDASVELFMECYAETITIDSDAAAQEQDSPRLNKKCKALIKATHRRKKLLGFMKGSARLLKSAAAVAIAFLALSSFLFITVDAVREPILKFYIKQNDGNWELSNIPFESEPDDPMYTAPEAGFNEEDPLQYLLPKGFTLISVNGNLEKHLAARYQNAQCQEVIFEYHKSNALININTEDAEMTRLQVSGYDAVLSEHKTTKNLLLIWYNSDLNYTLSLNTNALTKDELIAIAESLNYLLMK